MNGVPDDMVQRRERGDSDDEHRRTNERECFEMVEG